MTQDPIRVADYLEHIIQAIQRIKRYTDDISEVTFLENRIEKIIQQPKPDTDA